MCLKKVPFPFSVSNLVINNNEINYHTRDGKLRMQCKDCGIHVRPITMTCQPCGGCELYCFEDFLDFMLDD